MNTYIYQVDGKIVAVNSGNYEITSEGWVLVSDSKTEAELFPKGLVTARGGYNYSYIDDEIVERSAEKIAADEEAANPEQNPPGGSDTAVWDELDAAYQAGYKEGVESV